LKPTKKYASRELTHPVWRALVISLLFTVLGCATPELNSILRKINEDPSNAAFIENVPHYPQKRFMCGPAALTSVINYYAVTSGSAPVTLAKVERAVFMKTIRTTLMMDMLIYAKRLDLDTEYRTGDLEWLQSELSKGHPVILLINEGLKEYPVGHYIVAVGFHEKEKVVLALSGNSLTKPISYRRLMKVWEKGGLQALLIQNKKGVRQ
jgi:hypothetical protein